MRILVVCDYGENRSVTVAHHLKFMGHETIAIGLETTTPATQSMLGEWADRIIFTDTDQPERFVEGYDEIAQVWPIGPDRYPRPFNKQLRRLTLALLDKHKDEYVVTTSKRFSRA